jgi:hypothetical protein
MVFVAALAVVQSAEANSKRYNHRLPTPAAEQPATARSKGVQPRDPGDIALEKKIRSICGGC